jgi:AcrR family transcriptional regulator
MTSSPPAEGSPRDTGVNPDGKITRGVVLAAALELIDRDGAERLSMRRLARALNRDPMVLYRHTPDKAALLDGVAEVVLAQLKVDPSDPDWAGQLRAIARDPSLRWDTCSVTLRGSCRLPLTIRIRLSVRRQQLEWWAAVVPGTVVLSSYVRTAFGVPVAGKPVADQRVLAITCGIEALRPPSH